MKGERSAVCCNMQLARQIHITQALKSYGAKFKFRLPQPGAARSHPLHHRVPISDMRLTRTAPQGCDNKLDDAWGTTVWVKKTGIQPTVINGVRGAMVLQTDMFPHAVDKRNRVWGNQ